MRIILAVLLAILLTDMAEARRVALVIGNGNYVRADRLLNPANDAAAIGSAFKRLSFDKVVVQTDLGADGMRKLLQDFEADATGAEIAVVYFAGHGIEVDGVNYLVPTDARLVRATSLEDEAIALSRVARAIDGAKKLRLVILDACRNNPFRAQLMADASGRRRSIGRGLAKVEPGENELVAFAAAGGTEAADGDGRNSPFTAALVKHIETPGLDIRILFGRVRDEVVAATGRTQTPHVYGTLGGEQIVLRPGTAQTAAPSPEAGDTELRRRLRIQIASAKTEAELDTLEKLDPGLSSDITRRRVALLDEQRRRDPALSVKPGSGQSFRDCLECPEMVVVPAGSFTMGAPASEEGRSAGEAPQHSVSIDRAFAVSKYEITVGEFIAFNTMNSALNNRTACRISTGASWRNEPDRSYENPGFPQTKNHPVVCVSWFDASNFATLIAARTNKKYRLLSEAEWEYVARVGQQSPFHWGRGIEPSMANYAFSSLDRRTLEVGRFKPNLWGLYDTSGNVWEWVTDCWSAYSTKTRDSSSLKFGDCSVRVLRGGAWDSPPRFLRSATRWKSPPDSKFNYVGFRVAREL